MLLCSGTLRYAAGANADVGGQIQNEASRQNEWSEKQHISFASQQGFCKLPLGHFIRGDSGHVIKLLKMSPF